MKLFCFLLLPFKVQKVTFFQTLFVENFPTKVAQTTFPNLKTKKQDKKAINCKTHTMPTYSVCQEATERN